MGIVFTIYDLTESATTSSPASFVLSPNSQAVHNDCAEATLPSLHFTALNIDLCV